MFPCGFGAKTEEGKSKTTQSPFFARPKPKIPFIDLSLFRNQTETPATKATVNINRILMSTGNFLRSQAFSISVISHSVYKLS